MNRQPIDASKLTPGLKKYVGEAVPSGLKLVAARGLVPLKPVELVTLLYCFHFDLDAQVRETAAQAVRGLAPQVLNAVLDAPLAPEVLDLLAEAYADHPLTVSRIILNRNTSDGTIELLAQLGGEETLDLIANNQVRFLRAPNIIRAMHSNPFARQATLDSVIELARRNGIDTDALLNPAPPPGDAPADVPAGEEPAAEEGPGAAPAGALPAAAPAAAGEAGPGDLAAKVPEHYLKPGVEFTDAQTKQFNLWMVDAPTDLLIRLAQYGNAVSAILLAKTRLKDVALALVKNKNLDMLKHWTKIAADRQCNDDLIKYMCGKKDFTNVYNIKVKLALNPKTAAGNAMAFTRSMRLSDLKTMAKNKAAPVTLQLTAKSILKMHGVNLDEPKKPGGH